MLRIFIRSYLVIIIPAILLLMLFNPATWVLERTAYAHFRAQLEGVFLLLQDELKAKPEAQWKQTIEELQQKFRVRIDLKKLDELKLPGADIKRLRNNGGIIKLSRYSKMYSVVENSAYVLIMDTDISEEDKDSLFMEGPLYLLERKLASIPESRWAEIAHDLNSRVKLNIQLLTKDTLPEAVVKNPRLAWGKSVEETVKKNLYNIYSPTSNPEKFWKFGPIDERDLNAQIEKVNWLVPAATLAIANLLLALMAWWEVRQLRRVSRKFGDGDLSARSTLKSYAALKPLADTFNQMAERIQRQVEGQRELTNAVSHELRTPLSRMRFGLEMLEQETDQQEKKRFHEGLDRDMEELEQLVDELLTHSRFDRPHQAADLPVSDLYQWLKNFVDAYSTALPECPSIRLKSENPDQSCLAAFDSQALARAISNLMTNACRHAESRIELSIEQHSGSCCIQVEDDGPGVPEADYQRIFEPFTRLDSSRGRESGGYGLGLAIVKRIATWLGGQIFVSDSPLGGARFSLCLPISAKGR